jgi:hypothetical protein
VWGGVIFKYKRGDTQLPVVALTTQTRLSLSQFQTASHHAVYTPEASSRLSVPSRDMENSPSQTGILVVVYFFISSNKPKEKNEQFFFAQIFKHFL